MNKSNTRMKHGIIKEKVKRKMHHEKTKSWRNAVRNRRHPNM